jgi:glycosyltransferase involved in cell wall biosynthesis
MSTPILLVVGEGPERASIERRIAELGLSENVRMLGHRDDVFELVSALDILVQPSVTLEAFPYSVVEAMFAGVPSVVSDVGGAKEIVNASEGGYVVPKGDGAALADALSRYIDDEGKRRADGACARRFAENNLTASKMADATLDVYERLLRN